MLPELSYCLCPPEIDEPYWYGLLPERSATQMYDLLVVVVALITFTAMGAFVYFCERI